MGFLYFFLYSIGCIVSASRDSVQRDDPTHVIGQPLIVSVAVAEIVFYNRCSCVGLLVMFFYVVVGYHSALIILCPTMPILAVYAELSVVVFWTALLLPPAPASLLGL